MKVSTKLFNQQQLKQFTSLNEEIQKTQNKISTGKNILLASDDPTGSVQLSGLQVIRDQINQYNKNIETSKERLTLLDKNLQKSSHHQHQNIHCCLKSTLLTLN